MLRFNFHSVKNRLEKSYYAKRNDLINCIVHETGNSSPAYYSAQLFPLLLLSISVKRRRGNLWKDVSSSSSRSSTYFPDAIILFQPSTTLFQRKAVSAFLKVINMLRKHHFGNTRDSHASALTMNVIVIFYCAR